MSSTHEHPHDDPGDEVLTIEETAKVAAEVGEPVSVSTLRSYRLRGDGGPPSYRRGHRVVYLRREVEAWAAERSRLVPASPSATA